MFRSIQYVFVLTAMLVCGCTSLHDYIHNGFKVGPNYCTPQADVAQQWIDQADLGTPREPENLARWWKIFNDPKLDGLIVEACQQNLSLKEAGFRILKARATLGIQVGNLFPQSQNASGDYRRSGAPFADSWDYGFNLSWELDFWGRYRRAVAAAEDQLEASVASYDGVMVTLLGDVAQNYVRIRTDQERIALLEANVKLQQGVLNYIEHRYNAGYKQTELDLDQALSNVRQTEAAINVLEIDKRQAENRLCTLMGIPTADLAERLGEGPVPTCPPEVAIGIPADLLRQRPDVRRAERLAAAQAEQIGIAQSDFYPALSINGSLGYRAQNFSDLFHSDAFSSSVGPSFRWNLLNYGRILNNVRYQEAAFQELVAAYQNTVLLANEEVENGLVTFLRSQRRTKLLTESVDAANKAVNIVVLQYRKGAVDFNRYAVIEQNLVTQQDSLAQARGQIAQGLISIYRALGGGWEISREGLEGLEETAAMPEPAAAPAAEGPEELPAVVPEPPQLPLEHPQAPKPPTNEPKSPENPVKLPEAPVLPTKESKTPDATSQLPEAPEPPAPESRSEAKPAETKAP